MAKKRGEARNQEVFPVDERLVMPESGVELLEGKLLIVPGADTPHARQHAQLAFLLWAHAAPGFQAVVDMLTRTSAVSDFAPDASIFPEGPDVVTGGRRLEVLAFEIVSKQRLGIPTKKARELSRRGVARVFAVVVARERVLEWDARGDRFRPMHPDEEIEHACLVAPVPVRALLDAARADRAVMAALAARNPEMVEEHDREVAAKAAADAEARAANVAAEAEARAAKVAVEAEARGEAKGEARGEARALARAVLVAAAAAGVEPPPGAAAALAEATPDTLRALLTTVVRDRRWPR